MANSQFIGMTAPVNIADKEDIKDAHSKLLNPKNLYGWIVIGYKDANTIMLQAKGDGSVEDMVSKLEDGQVQYCILRLRESDKELVEDRRDGKSATKDIFINWLGPKVGRVERGKKQGHNPAVTEFFKPFHVELTALSRTNLNEKTIREKATPNSGSHQID